jgi:expansin (peptidoglycan-binding protein)
MVVLTIFVVLSSLSYNILCQTPLQLCTFGRATEYTFSGPGACGFGAISPYIIAPNEAYYNGSLECGQCYEVSAPLGTILAIVGDYCPVQGNEQWCSGDMVHFDMASAGFNQIAQPAWGVIEMNYRKVACPVSGPVQVVVDSSTNPSYLNIYPFNYVVGVLTVEIQENGGSWITLPRAMYNRFEYSPGRNLNYPINVRMTSIYNTQVTATLQSNSPGAVVNASGQFPTPPQVGSSSQCPFVREPYIYREGLNDGGTHPTAMNWISTSWGLQNNTDWFYTVNPYAGMYCLQTSIDPWGALSFYVSAEISSSEIVGFDFWMRASTPYNSMFLYWEDASTNTVNLPQIGTSWTHVYLPVTQWPSPIPSSIHKITLQNQGNPSPNLYFDEIQVVLNTSVPSPSTGYPVPSTSSSLPPSSPSTGIPTPPTSTLPVTGLQPQSSSSPPSRALAVTSSNTPLAIMASGMENLVQIAVVTTLLMFDVLLIN